MKPFQLIVFLTAMLAAPPLLSQTGDARPSLETITSSATRPSATDVVEWYRHRYGQPDTSVETRIRLEPIIASAAKAIASLEYIYPGARWATLGRDVEYFADVLELFYKHHFDDPTRVVRVPMSTNTFTSTDSEKLPGLILDLLAQKGLVLDPSAIEQSHPFVVLDRTSFVWEGSTSESANWTSQSRQIVEAVYDGYLAQGGKSSELLRRFNVVSLCTHGWIVGDSQTTVSLESPALKDWYFHTQANLLRRSRRDPPIQSPTRVLQIRTDESLTDRGEWHQTFGKLERVDGEVIAHVPKEEDPDEKKRLKIIEQMIELDGIVSQPQFLERVRHEASLLGYEFPEVRPAPESMRIPRAKIPDVQELSDFIAGQEEIDTGKKRRAVLGRIRSHFEVLSGRRQSEHHEALLFVVDELFRAWDREQVELPRFLKMLKEVIQRHTRKKYRLDIALKVIDGFDRRLDTDLEREPIPLDLVTDLPSLLSLKPADTKRYWEHLYRLYFDRFEKGVLSENDLARFLARGQLPEGPAGQTLVDELVQISPNSLDVEVGYLVRYGLFKRLNHLIDVKIIHEKMMSQSSLIKTRFSSPDDDKEQRSFMIRLGNMILAARANNELSDSQIKIFFRNNAQALLGADSAWLKSQLQAENRLATLWAEAIYEQGDLKQASEEFLGMKIRYRLSCDTSFQ